MITDNDLVRAWLLVHELSDQLAHNQKISNALQSQAGALKTQATHNGSGFALRRFNVDISKEFFDSELERMNAQFIIENQTLLHENKQLSVLLKEYESTMETIMTKFRNHALAAQQHELTLTRHYEALLLACDSQNLYADLSSETNISTSLQRLAQHLRALLRTMSGEDPEQIAEHSDDAPVDINALVQALDAETGTEVRDDWALERECEIMRLEKENEELRRMLGIDPETLSANNITLDLDREESGRFSTLLSAEARKRRESAAMNSRSGWGFENDRDVNPWNGWEINTNAHSAQNSLPQHQMMQQQHQQQQHQQQLGNGTPLQRAMDLQMRIPPPRRPMFARNSGPAPPVSVPPNRGHNVPLSQWSQTPMSERASWLQGGSTLDLSR
ncbi:hypothetical protein BJ138DRAFT_917687 [Hygrophoropsis aurantiaca]|uniref:Uncharacterized protein n=1 Tax=Hygrophoropsis aurantiaca TaxID=72124 RepID=A0ACB8AR72_9AGAM|nr:hypothetical protein BJ138DRAFT_917687 [Hygrophoropsis aurantiaca]